MAGFIIDVMVLEGQNRPNAGSWGANVVGVACNCGAGTWGGELGVNCFGGGCLVCFLSFYFSGPQLPGLDA